jgi:hypothetical protein
MYITSALFVDFHIFSSICESQTLIIIIIMIIILMCQQMFSRVFYFVVRRANESWRQECSVSQKSRKWRHELGTLSHRWRQWGFMLNPSSHELTIDLEIRWLGVITFLARKCEISRDLARKCAFRVLAWNMRGNARSREISRGNVRFALNRARKWAIARGTATSAAS